MRNGIKVFAPATVANVACGFDILGFAIDSPGDEIVAKRNPNSKELRITDITGSKLKLPYETDKNTATIGILNLLKDLKINNIGIDLEIHKKMPFGSGMGSSAASACGGVFVVNELLKLGLEKKELIKYALDGEFIASGGYHADNIAPCMLGGIQLSKDANYYRLPLPKGLHVLMVYQQVEILTKAARKILSDTITLQQHIEQNTNLAGLIIGLYNADYSLLKNSLKDVIIEEQRKHLIPNFDFIKNITSFNNALGCSISGSGPTIFAIFDNTINMDAAKESIEKELVKQKRRFKIYESQINQEGTILL
jgi:homoserine kinase